MNVVLLFESVDGIVKCNSSYRRYLAIVLFIAIRLKKNSYLEILEKVLKIVLTAGVGIGSVLPVINPQGSI